MKKSIWLLIVLTLVSTTLLLTADESTSGEVMVEVEETTLIGKYHWERGETHGDLKAIFTPTEEENTYDVSFHFDFRDEAHIYTGVAKGNLHDGALEGEVLNEGKNRTFTFEGNVEDGKFEGTHAEVGGRFGSRQTGTLTLG